MITSCQFCDLANGIEPANIVYQTHHVCCFLDINPIHEGHILIVPKKHFLDVDKHCEFNPFDIELNFRIFNSVPTLGKLFCWVNSCFILLKTAIKFTHLKQFIAISHNNQQQLKSVLTRKLEL